MSVLTAALGFIGAMLVAFITRDAYASLPWLRHHLIDLAASRLPDHLREIKREEWRAVLEDIPPSELLKTMHAFGFLYAAQAICQESRLASTVRQEKHKQSSYAEKYMLELVQEIRAFNSNYPNHRINATYETVIFILIRSTFIFRVYYGMARDLLASLSSFL